MEWNPRPAAPAPIRVPEGRASHAGKMNNATKQYARWGWECRCDTQAAPGDYSRKSHGSANSGRPRLALLHRMKRRSGACAVRWHWYSPAAAVVRWSVACGRGGDPPFLTFVQERVGGSSGYALRVGVLLFACAVRIQCDVASGGWSD